MRPSINIKIALRSIINNKVQSLVSVLGLGIGLGSIILISLLYMHENSFDRYIPETIRFIGYYMELIVVPPFLLEKLLKMRFLQ